MKQNILVPSDNNEGAAAEAVHCPTVEIFLALFKLLKDVGLPITDSDKAMYYNKYQYTFITASAGRFSAGLGGYKMITIDEFIKRVQAHSTAPRMTLTDDYWAELTPQGIIVGCQTVTWDKWDELKQLVKAYNNK